MKLARTDEQRLVVDTIRSFIRNEVRPLEADLDPEAYTLPAAHHERLTRMVQELGFYQPDVPEEFGGPGIDLVTRAMMAEEMSQHRAGVSAPAYGVFGTPPPGELYAAGEEQRARYLEPAVRGERRGFVAMAEEGGGSDPARAVQTRAERNGSGWVLTGRKLWNMGIEAADFAVVYARTDPMKDREGVSAFVVDTAAEGMAVDKVVQMIWSRNASEVSLSGVKVPAEHLIGEEGRGLALAERVQARALIPDAGECIGVGVYATELAIDWARQRKTFGEPLAERQAIQWMLVDNELDTQAARWITLDAASKADAGEPYAYEAAMAKLAASEGASRVVDRSMQIYGGLGMAKDMPFERWFRELRVRRIAGGPSELHRITIANRMLRRESD